MTFLRTEFCSILMAAALGACAPTGQMAEDRPPAVKAQFVQPLPPNSATLSRIAFGSCNNQRRASPLLDAVAAAKPDLFLFAGDTVYADDKSHPADPKMLRREYARLANQGYFQALRRSTPVLAVWDDHDFGRNDGGGGDYNPFMQNAFLDFWQAPNKDQRRTRKGVYGAWTFGPAGRRVQIILLDTRSFRSDLKRMTNKLRLGRYEPDGDAAKTMLGGAQWRWLGRALKEKAELRLVVSTIQILSEGHRWERWGNLPAERDKLKALLRSTGANGVVLLSGDRHLGAFYRDRESLAYPLWEVTSSALNRTWTTALSEDGPYIRGDVIRQDNFGLVEIDWRKGRVDLSLRGADGEILRRHRLGLTELTAPGS